MLQTQNDYQADYFDELKLITSEIDAAVFSLECLCLYSFGQLPWLESCPKSVPQSCWQHTTGILNQNLHDLREVLGFLEESFAQLTAPEAKPQVSGLKIPPAPAGHAAAANSGSVHLS